MKERSPTGFALSFLMSRFGEKKRAELGCLGIISAVRWPTVPLFFFVRHEHAESRGMLSGLGFGAAAGGAAAPEESGKKPMLVLPALRNRSRILFKRCFNFFYFYQENSQDMVNFHSSCRSTFSPQAEVRKAL